jgi:ABC-2 type transport system permease protein
VHDPAGAKKIKDKYSKYGFGSVEDKNLIIFEANGVQFVHGDLLGDYKLEAVPNAEEREFKNSLRAFKGEGVFNSALVSVASTKPLQGYFLNGHGEHDPRGKDNAGYLSFTKILPQNYVMPNLLDLVGTNTIPSDCNLLIIAGPTRALLPSEVEKLRQYLAKGGKMFVLLNSDAVVNNINTGLEGLLAEWGVDVGRNYIKDPSATTSDSGYDMLVSKFSESHPVVNPLMASRLRMILPRSVGKLEIVKQGAETPKVEVLAWTSEKALINNSIVPTGKPVPLMAAVEKGAIKGVYTENGTTRIVVAGDSFFLNNQLIEMDRNQEFAVNAINWLLDRTQLLQGVGPRPVTEYRFLMTKPQMKSVQWLLLAGMPGVILLLGGLVWLRRRH